jgi:hypothetical protein
MRLGDSGETIKVIFEWREEVVQFYRNKFGRIGCCPANRNTKLGASKMNTLSIVLVASTLATMALGAHADTQKVEGTAYQVIIEDPTEVTLPNGTKVMVNGLNHASVVNSDGETASQWCQGDTIGSEDGRPAAGAGFCSIIDAQGEIMWVWFRLEGEGQGTWGVIGGTGANEGATGGGTTSVVAGGGDGRTWTSKSSGTITTK